MRDYALQRLMLIVPTVLFVSLIVFTLIRLLPGNVVNLMLGENAYASNMEALRHKLGLDAPFHEQYITWIGNMARGDFGKSLWTDRAASEEILARLPVSIELGILALLVSISISLPVGVFSAVRQDTWLDYLFRSLAIGALSIPGFWIATLIITFPSVWFGWVPAIKYVPLTKDPVANLSQFIIPAAILGSAMAGGLMRMTRAMMLEVLREDYIRTAWAKGLRERQAVYRHALRNAMIPIVTVIGMQIPLVLGGSVIMENIFGLPGIGNLVLDSITKRDYPMLQSVNLVFAVGVMVINLVVDMTYGYLDPRIRFR